MSSRAQINIGCSNGDTSELMSDYNSVPTSSNTLSQSTSVKHRSSFQTRLPYFSSCVYNLGRMTIVDPVFMLNKA